LSEGAHVSRRVLADQVHELLTVRILDKHYQPGERLNIDALARDLGVSSTPLREALTRLVAERLVVASSFVGFAVAPLPDRSWFAAMHDYRVVLEAWAVREATRHRSDAPIEAMHAAVEALHRASSGSSFREYQLALKADADFHQLIMAATKNPVAQDTYRDLNPHLHFVRLSNQYPESLSEIAQEHRVVLDAIERGDADVAAAAMVKHLDEGQRRFIGGL
jgi:DNA-binding GntR family transcriptional regulator